MLFAVRNQRRRELSSILHERQKLVDSLLQLKSGTAPQEITCKSRRRTGTRSSGQKVSQRVGAPLLKRPNTAGSWNSAMPAANFRYIGLCYGPPGIGKTLSAVRYSRADQIIPRDRWTSEVSDDLPVDTLLYTTSVINTPSGVRNDISLARERVMSIVLDPIRREALLS